MPETPKDAQPALQELFAYRQRLEDQLADLGGKLDAVNSAIRLLASEGPTGTDELLARGTKYTSMPPQQAAELFLREHPKGAFKASDVARALRDEGLVPRARNFNSQITVALNRLVEKDVAESDKANGVTVYHLRRDKGPAP